MYRQSAPPEPQEAAPTELDVPLHPDRRGKSAYALMQMFALPGVLGVVCSMIGSPTLGLAAMVGSAAGGVWWWRRQPDKGPSLTLHVEHGELFVRARKHLKAHVRLTDLVDVTLDTKAIQRVSDGPSAIPAMRFIDSQVSAEVDIARIVLAPRNELPVALSEEYLAHMIASEWLGKIRVFLRKNGWVPEDERDEVESNG